MVKQKLPDKILTIAVTIVFGYLLGTVLYTVFNWMVLN